jgi:hypothetical protein
MKRQ